MPVSQKQLNPEAQINFQRRLDALLGTNSDLPSQAPSQTPGTIPQNLPWTRAENFVGRGEAMESLHQKLQKSQRVFVTAGDGIQGAGKTELALQYARHHLQEETYPGGIFWFWGQERELDAGIVGFAKYQLNLNPPENANLAEQLDYCWRNWQGGETLIIFDEARDYTSIENYLPPAELGFKVLVTTLGESFDNSFEELKLGTLDEEAALELLASFVGKERIQGDLKGAKELCAHLGFLPFGLDLAGRYLQRQPELSLGAMCQQLEGGEKKTVFDWILEELKDDKMREFAYLLSLLAQTAVPRSLLPPLMPGAKEADLESWLDEEFVNLGLLQQVDEESVIMDPEVQQLVGTKLLSESDRAGSVCRAIAAVGKAIAGKLNPQEILAIAPVIPHVAEVAEGCTEKFEAEQLIWPFAGLAKYYSSQGFYEPAKAWLDRGLAYAEDFLESPNQDIAVLLNNLGTVYLSQEQYQEAEKKLLEALEMRKQVLDGAHPDVVATLQNLVEVYSSQEQHEKAEPLYLEALEMTRELLGPAHSQLATNINNLAGFYYSQGRYEEAEPLLVEALEMKKQLLGTLHPDVASSINNLATLYQSQERYEEAEPLLLEALEMNERVLGTAHPDYAINLNNLADLYKYLGRFSEAEPLYLQALDIFNAQLGQNHPNTKAVVKNYIRFLREVVQAGRQGELSKEMSLQIISQIGNSGK